MVPPSGLHIVRHIIIIWHHFDVEIKCSSAEWVPEGDQLPVKARRSRSKGRRMFAIFFDSRSLFAMVKVEGQATVTAHWYVEKCLPEVIDSVTRRAPRTRMRGPKLHDDNAPAHTAAATRGFLTEQGISTLSLAFTLTRRIQPLEISDFSNCLVMQTW